MADQLDKFINENRSKFDTENLVNKIRCCTSCSSENAPNQDTKPRNC